MRNKSTKTLSFLLIAGLAIGMASTGAAIDPIETTMEAISCTQFLTHLAPQCFGELAINGIVSENIEDAHRDAYESALYLNDERDRGITEQNSNLNHSYSLALAHAKLQVLNHLKNGSSQVKAQEAAKEEVNDVFSAHQDRVIQHQNSEALQFESLISDIESTVGLSHSDVFDLANDSHEYHPDIEENHELQDTGFTADSRNITLFNGSEREIHFIQVNMDVYEPENDVTSHYTYVIGHYWGENGGWNAMPIDATHPTSDSVVDALEGNEWNRTWNNVKSDRDRALENIANYASESYNEFDNGLPFNISELMTPIEQMHVASTNYDDTGHYSWLALQLEQMGLASNRSYAFKVKFNNSGMEEKTRSGQLFVNDAYNNTLEVGKEYDASNEDVWFVYQTEDGDAAEIDLDGTFEILEMTDKSTGEEINSTTLQETEIYTESTEDLEKQLEELNETANYIEELSSSIGGGWISDGWISDGLDSIASMLDISKQALAVLLVIAGILVVLWV